MTTHPREQLSAYADGELDRVTTAEVDRHLETCTECARELSIVRKLKGAMQDMQISRSEKDLWSGVHRRLTAPVGWLLIVAGTVMWAALAVVRWAQTAELTPEWLGGSALLIGLVLLLVAITHQQYRAWKTERYKDVDK
ncbi:MAG TPA: zf-HC2 domain-containing protein [Thermoanaerobaculia bacterium]